MANSLVFAFGLCLLLGVGIGTARAQDARFNAPGIQFENTTFNFGNLRQGEVAEHAFTFRNTGDRPLEIRNVRTSCGCTASEWTREPIAPGGTGRIVARFNSAGKSGHQHKTLTVETNIEGEPFMQLILQGDVAVPPTPVAN